MKKTVINKLFLLFIGGIIIGSILIPLSFPDKKSILTKDNGIYTTKAINDEKLPKSAADTFKLNQDFTTSSYYISPESSLGEKDGVYFSFEANRNGSYTIDIENFPNPLTLPSTYQLSPSFDNPSGTDLFYISYIEVDTTAIDTIKLRLLTSKDCGNTWNDTIVASIQTQGEDFLDLANYLMGTAVAADPSTGVIGIITYSNRTDSDRAELRYFGSVDNGTTWSISKGINTTQEIGCETLMAKWDWVTKKVPSTDLAILSNGTIYALSETASNSYTDIVYFKSNNNGNNWEGPFNISSIKSITCKKPRIQVNRTGENYWLAYKIIGSPNTIRWSQFSSSQNQGLGASVSTKNITIVDTDGNFDFIYDSKEDKFRLITVNTSEIYNYTTPDFDTAWTSTSLGRIDEICDVQNNPLRQFNIAHDEENYQFFFGDDILGPEDIFHYIYYENSTFRRIIGTFIENQFNQIYWNGKIDDTTPIPIKKVKIEFSARNGTSTINKTLYITIDNSLPSLSIFNQNHYYFNPLASNFSFSEILWDLLPSESCYANLEIYSENRTISDLITLTDNNFDDSVSILFQSYTNQLYAVYQTLESGRIVIYLIKSLDFGVTWSNPIEIYQTSVDTEWIYFRGAAWGDIVTIFLGDEIAGGNCYIYRSYDEGTTWQEPINIEEIEFLENFNGKVADVEFTNNGTLYFICHDNGRLPPPWGGIFGPRTFYVFKSADLGVTWTTSLQWTQIYGLFWYDSMSPALGYDPVNELIHVVMPVIEYNYPPVQVNFTFCTLNLSTNSWNDVISADIFSILYVQGWDPDIIVTRENSSSPIITRVVVPVNIKIEQGVASFQLKEFNSTNLGKSWNNLTDSSIQTRVSVSDLDNTYYLGGFSDGNDNEIYFAREGYLVKNERFTINHQNITEFVFDGVKDFGGYIDNGNYSYTITLEDSANNRVNITGWFYADYDAPQITEYTTDWSITPTPRYDLTVTVNITDSINFTAYLYYKKDNQDWEPILMNNIGGERFSATIPKDTITSSVIYYIKAIDLAGNEFDLDNNGNYYSYDMPVYVWDSEGLFKETKSYSSSTNYDISVTILSDLEYVREVIFRYSYDEGDDWDDLELERSSPEFEGELDDIPEDLRELYYKIVIIDIFGNEIELTGTRKVDFYPDVPSLELNPFGMVIAGLVSATMGILVAIGYINLKKTSHDTIHKQMFYKKYKQTTTISGDVDDKSSIKKTQVIGEEASKELDISKGFDLAYFGMLLSTIGVLLIGSLISGIFPLMSLYLILGSLIMSVFGYMILMSKHITTNIYLEKIHKKTVILDAIQIAVMFTIIIMLMIVGNAIPWFRYYLLESTFDIGTVSLPALYLTIISVFFTSLVLVIFSTYLQVRKTVKNIQKHRKQGETGNFLLFTKDQSSSKIMSQLAIKTMAFLGAVLISIVTTANLITVSTGIVLVVIFIPCIIACTLILLLHFVKTKKTAKTQKKDIEMPFIDKEKTCVKCGETTFLSDKFCGACGAQLILPEKLGTYVARCTKCDALINDKAKHCPSCGMRV